jgi:hypothetical protein
MSSKWFYKDSAGQEQGPVGFEILARLVVDGELTESDLVRSADSKEWTELDLVIGLHKTVDRLRKHQAATRNESVHQAPAEPPRRRSQLSSCRTSTADSVAVVQPSGTAGSDRWARASISPFRLAVVLAASVGIIGFVYWLRSPARFPESAHSRQGSVPSIWNLPGIGAVNQFELTIVVVNVLLILFATVFFWVARKQKQRCGDVRGTTGR